jgi:methionyl-tRNA synthetase
VRGYEAEITELLEWANLRDAYHKIFELAAFANKTFQDGEPWKKRESAPEEAATLIGNLAYIVRDLAILTEPYTPETSERIAGFLGKTFKRDAPDHLSWANLGKLEGLSRVEKSEVLFAKLEGPKLDGLRKKYSGSQAERKDKKEKNASRQDTKTQSNLGGLAASREVVQPPPSVRFANLIDLRVAEIKAVERHPNADKLYVISLDIAGEPRTIVSGLVGFYTEEQLIGKHIIVAFNLKASKLRGIESKGMLLAASCETPDGREICDVLDAGTTPSGTRVTIEGAVPPEEALKEIKADVFFSVPISVRDYAVNIEGKALLLDGVPIKTQTAANGTVG